MRIMTETQMRNVSTIVLVRYKNKLLKCNRQIIDPLKTDGLQKESDEWKDAYAAVRKILDERIVD